MTTCCRVLVLLTAVASGPAVQAAGQGIERTQVMAARVAQDCAAFEAKMNRPSPQPTVRELTACAWGLLELGRDPADAEELLRRAFSLQDLNTNSPGYGTVPWQEGHPEIQDANAIEFTFLPVGPILLRHRAALSERFLKDSLPHLSAGLIAIQRHKVRPSYSNIYLMRMANLLLVGQAIGDTSAVEQGQAALDAWLTFTRTNGVAEYDSPTYTPIQADCLALAYAFVPDATTKTRLKAALDFLWAGFAANYFGGRQTMAAPASRDYNFLFSDENVNWTYYFAGLRAAEPGRVFLSDAVRLWATARLDGFRPAPAMLDLAALPERVVRSRFGQRPGQDRYVFLTPDFALGSASAYYGPQDKRISLALASSRPLPVISFVADPFDAPFGRVRMMDRSGHRKPRHLAHLLATVQERGFLLALCDLSPELARRELTNLASNVILPMNAERVWLDGTPVDTAKPFDLPAGPASVVVLREGRTAVAVRLFAADGCAGRTPLWRLKYDGSAHGAGRLVAYHYRGSERQLAEPGVCAGFWLLAARCETEPEFTAFVEGARKTALNQRLEDGLWRVNARHGDIELEAGLDLKRKQIATRRVNGKDWHAPVLMVNERDWAAEILGTESVGRD